MDAGSSTMYLWQVGRRTWFNPYDFASSIVSIGTGVDVVCEGVYPLIAYPVKLVCNGLVDFAAGYLKVQNSANKIWFLKHKYKSFT